MTLEPEYDIIFCGTEKSEPVEHLYGGGLLPSFQKGANISFVSLRVLLEGGGNDVHNIDRSVNAFDLDYRSRRLFY